MFSKIAKCSVRNRPDLMLSICVHTRIVCMSFLCVNRYILRETFRDSGATIQYLSLRNRRNKPLRSINEFPKGHFSFYSGFLHQFRLADRLFHNLRASKSIDLQTSCSLETSIDRLVWRLKNVKGPVGLWNGFLWFI